MFHRTAVVAFVVLVAASVAPPGTQAAPCAQACKDEVAACRADQCATLKGRARRQCRHQCKTRMVQDCYTDLAVCGATSARPTPSKPPTGPTGGW